MKVISSGVAVTLLVITEFVAIAQGQANVHLEHGTVIVIYFTKDKIIMAADSRLTWYDHSAPPDDTVCKIATPGGKVVFASAGLMDAGIRINGVPSPSYSRTTNNDAARKAYDETRATVRRAATDSERLYLTAMQWGKLISSQLDNVVRSDLDHKPITPLEMPVSYFGGLGDNGTLILLRVALNSQNEGYGGFYATPHPIACPNSYCIEGETRIASEFIDLTSARAKQEAREWQPPKGSKPSDYDILKAMRLVKLTEMYGPKDVGGPIDAVELDRDGGLRWFANKKKCRTD